jgi:hypothetical protein
LNFTLNTYMVKTETIYSVILNKNKLTCINTKNGATLGVFSFTGEILTGPIVTGNNQCTVVFATPTGRRVRVFKLPNFTTITNFNM